MTDQPNTETDAEFVERIERDTALVEIGVGGTAPAYLDGDHDRVVAMLRRAVAPAPAGDVEQFGVWLAAYQEDSGRDLSHHMEWYSNFYQQHKDAEHLGDCPYAKVTGPITCDRCVCDEMVNFARTALAAMPSGRQRGLLEAAPVAWQWRLNGSRDGLASKWHDCTKAQAEEYSTNNACDVRALYTAAEQLGEPDDGWLPIASAPKDRILDLWNGQRVVDCEWFVILHGPKTGEGVWRQKRHPSSGRVEGVTHYRLVPPAPSVPR